MIIFNKAVLFLIILVVNTAHAASFNKTLKQSFELGVQQYEHHQYIESETSFSQLTGYQARIGQAHSNYKLKKLTKSAALFKQSFLLADNDLQRFHSLYNAAVCEFLSGNYYSALLLFKDSVKYNENDKNALKFITLSNYLSELVNAQIARDNSISKKKKSSEGKKTVSSADFIFDESINLRIEDNDSSLSKTSNNIILTEVDNELVKALVDAGISSIKIKNKTLNKSNYSFIDNHIAYQYSNLNKASYSPKVAIPDLWKRIFELEVGFPASLEEAETMPGIRPW